MNKIKIIDKHSELTLDEFDLSEETLAYQRAVELEKMDIEATVILPNSIQQLGNALGASEDLLHKLKCDINDEIESH